MRLRIEDSSFLREQTHLASGLEALKGNRNQRHIGSSTGFDYTVLECSEIVFWLLGGLTGSLKQDLILWFKLY